MPLFGQRKSRSTKAAEIRSSSRLSVRLDHLLGDKRLLLRIGMCVATVVALLVVVEAWRPPFVYRLGQVPRNGVAARVDFERLDTAATDQRRNQREEGVPFVFRYDAEPLRSLPVRLRSSLDQIAEADTVDDLSPELRSAFGLGPSGRAADEMNEDFQQLKSVITGPEGSRIEEVVVEFDGLLAPLRRHGVADPDVIEEVGIRRDQTIAIVPENAPDSRVIVSPHQVQLSELLKDNGAVGELWSSYQRLSDIRPQLEQWIVTQTPFTLRYDRSATQAARREARENVDPVTVPYSQGDLLVPPGTPIDEAALAVLQAEYQALQARVSFTHRVVRTIVVALLLIVLAVLNGYYVVRNQQLLVASPGRLAVYLTTIVAAIGLSRLLSVDPWRAEIIPLMAAVMILAIAYDQVLATTTAFTMALVVTLSTVVDLQEFVVLMSVVAVATIALRRVKSRSKLIKVGLTSAVVYFVVAWGTHVLSRSTFEAVDWTDGHLLVSTLRGAGWCIATGYLVAGSLPFIESAFGVVTDISLLEMGDVSHPLLQQLVRRAPGTYNHSINVASIGEAAAEKIGANGLLVRVGAYFHDIGKMLKPEYFIENIGEGAESRHAHLAPAMSTLIIIGHVKDGVELARQHNLPQALVDFIEQHHGTTLVAYFYRQAAEKAALEPDHRTDAEESSFRYPGPKPQTRESGVLMLADAVESASRTLSDPTPKRIESLVHELTHRRLMDGQFDESSLTLSEIRAVEESLVKSLIAVYHGRVKYPEQRTA